MNLMTTPSSSSSSLTMSSKEIAELTGKMHAHVLRDIRNMLTELGEDHTSFGSMSQDSYGRPQPVYVLSKDLTITLVTGYNVVMRHRIVTRWQELEAQVSQPVAALPNFNNPAPPFFPGQAGPLSSPLHLTQIACLRPYPSRREAPAWAASGPKPCL